MLFVNAPYASAANTQLNITIETQRSLSKKNKKTAVAKRKQIGNGQCMYKKNKIGKTEKLAETTIASIKRKTGRSATAEKAP